MMDIRRYDTGLLSSSMYLIVDGGRAVVIDPCRNTSVAQGLRVDLLVVTHEHYDHISGVNIWKERYGAPLFCSAACAQNLRSPRKNLARYFEAFCELQTWVPLEQIPKADLNYTCEADRTFTDVAQWRWQGHVFDFMEIPGHSQGSIGILLDGVHFFSGDSLMWGRSIELHFPGGSEELWERVGRPRVESLPAGTRVWPGHFDGYVL